MDRKTKALIDGLPPALRNLMLTRTVEEGECLIWTGMTCAAFHASAALPLRLHRRAHKSLAFAAAHDR
jgi:hypothetical protein